MTRTDRQYKKLPGKKRKFIGNNTAWLGKDHLLLVESSGISENYKRLYFKDIQAINVLKTPHALIVNSILLFLVVALTVAGRYLYTTPVYPVSVFMWIVAGVMLVYFIRNAPQGASCEFRLTTRVQTEKLPSVHTTRTLKKVMAILVPAIESRQGKLSAQSLPQVKSRMADRSGAKELPAGHTDSVMTRIWHRILFPMAVVSGGLIGISIIYHPPLLLVIGALLILLGFAVAIIAIGVQTGKKAHGMVKAGSWIIAALLLFTLAAGYVENMFYYFRSITEISTFQTYNQWEMMKIYARIDPTKNPLILGINIFEAAGLILSGMTGWYFLARDSEQ